MISPEASRRHWRSRGSGPIVSAAREQPHAGAVPADNQPIAVMLDLVHPVGVQSAAWRQGSGCGGDKSVSPNEGSGHAREIAACCEPPQPSCCRGVARIAISEIVEEEQESYSNAQRPSREFVRAS
jgi:hypothetical protein